MQRLLGTPLAVVLLLAIVACAQLGVVQPQGFEQQLAYGYGAVTTVRQSAADAIKAKTLTAADGKHVLTITDQARAGLDAAKLASSIGNSADAAAKLQLATGILTQLQRYLAERQVK